METESLIVDVINEQDDFIINPQNVIALVKEVIAFEGQRFNEVAVHFVPQARICELHSEFFDDPSPTDCISLPLDEDEEEAYRHLGDIFVCPYTAKEYVRVNGGDIGTEISLYVVHGLLHLMGYDDIEDNDCKEMRSAEEYHLRNLKEKGLCL